MNKEHSEPVLAFATICISTVVGILITLPISIALPGGTSLIPPLFGAVAGLLVGLRKRSSRPFLYLALVSALVLSWLLRPTMP